MGSVTIGIDLGQKRDPFAIAVVEVDIRGNEDHHLGRFLERLKLGTPYDVARDRVVWSRECIRSAGCARLCLHNRANRSWASLHNQSHSPIVWLQCRHAEQLIRQFAKRGSY